MTNLPENEVFVLDSAHGIYIPQIFAEMLSKPHEYELMMWDNEEELELLLKGPDEEAYWEAWEKVLNGHVMGKDGTQYTLYQDCDLFLIPEDTPERMKEVYKKRFAILLEDHNTTNRKEGSIMEYEGHPNFATWCVHMCIDNEKTYYTEKLGYLRLLDSDRVSETQARIICRAVLGKPRTKDLEPNCEDGTCGRCWGCIDWVSVAEDFTAELQELDNAN